MGSDYNNGVERANEIQRLARGVHEGSRAKQEENVKKLIEITGSKGKAEQAVKDAGGAGSTVIRRLFGR